MGRVRSPITDGDFRAAGIKLVAVLDEVRKLMPFPLLGFDTDNDSVFINETVRDYCVRLRHRLHALPSLPQERSGLG
jgi:hypothetical protein